MASPLPKVLHPVCGVPMIQRVIQACQEAGVQQIRVVVGHGAQLVRSVVEPLGVQTFVQSNQAGTGDAVRAAKVEDLHGDVMILNGDHPLIRAQDLIQFRQEFRDSRADVAIVSCEMNPDNAFGRIVRHNGAVRAIVEVKDASSDTMKIREVNTGIYLLQAETLQDYLPRLTNRNSKGEYYLTDLISMAVEDQCRVSAIRAKPAVAFGVNTQLELAKANRILFRQKAKSLMESGVLMLDPWSARIEPSVEIASGAVIHGAVHLKGQTKIGAFTSIEPNCMLSDCEVGEAVTVRAFSYLEKCKIANRASIGPFARLRPETEIGENAHVGNFVEMKKVKFGAGAKAGHLTYLGDAEVGSETNIGCGTITCNYATDHKKYKTKIGNRVFVGSDTQFVAPVEIGDDAIIASGSTVTENVPARALAIARARQVNKENFNPPPLPVEALDSEDN